MQSQLANSRQSTTSHSALTRHRFKIRRNRLLEDAFDQLSMLSEEDLKGPVCLLFLSSLFFVDPAHVGTFFQVFQQNIFRSYRFEWCLLMSMVLKRLGLTEVEFSRISWKISLEPLLMCSTVYSRYMIFCQFH